MQCELIVKLFAHLRPTHLCSYVLTASKLEAARNASRSLLAHWQSILIIKRRRDATRLCRRAVTSAVRIQAMMLVLNGAPCERGEIK